MNKHNEVETLYHKVLRLERERQQERRMVMFAIMQETVGKLQETVTKPPKETKQWN